MIRILNIIMLIVFLLCIGVQYNDPDPLPWVLAYAYATIVTALAIANRYTFMAALGLPAYLAGFAYFMPGWHPNTLLLLLEPKMSSLDVELAREAIGLLICAIWMGVLTVVSVRGYRNSAQPNDQPQTEETSA
jgi:hypothetical protein